MSNQVLHQEFGDEDYFPPEAIDLGMDLSGLSEECGTALLSLCNVDEVCHWCVCVFVKAEYFLYLKVEEVVLVVAVWLQWLG
jgi:hypothetical protein